MGDGRNKVKQRPVHCTSSDEPSSCTGPKLTYKMAALKETVMLYQLLFKEWVKKPPNLDKCGSYLAQLKVNVSLHA